MFSLFARLRQLILPGTAQPNDPALILGPDLPPCMQARYASAIFSRPPNTVSAGIAGKPWRFTNAQLISPPAGQNQVEDGWLLYDGAGNCGFIVTRVMTGANIAAGSIQGSEFFLPRITGGIGAYNGSQMLTQILGFGSIASRFAIGQAADGPALTPWTVDGISAGRGLRALVSSVANTAPIGAEAVILTAPSMTWFDGRCYAVTFEQLTQASVANFGDFFIRRTNLAGAVKVQIRHEFTAAGGASVMGRCYIRNTSGGDITDNIVLTMLASAGTVTGVGGATTVRRLHVLDCGAAADYPNAIQI